jgi:hypothetical protein
LRQIQQQRVWLGRGEGKGAPHTGGHAGAGGVKGKEASHLVPNHRLGIFCMSYAAAQTPAGHCTCSTLWPWLSHTSYQLFFPACRPHASASTTTASSRGSSCRTWASGCPIAPTYPGRLVCLAPLLSYVQVRPCSHGRTLQKKCLCYPDLHVVLADTCLKKPTNHVTWLFPAR